MATTIGELVGFIRADNSDFERGLARSQLRMEGFRLDTNGRLRDLRGRFVDSGQVMERALRGVGDEMGEVAQQTVVYSSVVDAESRTMEARLNRVRDAAQGMAGALGERLGRVRAALGGMSVDTERLGAMGARIGGIALSFAKVGAAIGSVVPLAGGLVGVLAQVGPAAGVAVTGIIALQLATQAFKLGMVGVGDAVKAAMDPSNPAAFEEAIKKLAPNAQAFAREVKTLAPELKALQQGVQQRMFAGLDGVLREMGKTTLPVLKKGLFDTGDALNLMGKNIGNTAIGMSKSGVLGQALSGATDGLKNLSRVPSQLMLGLTQVGAAAAPTFRRLTDAAGKGADGISERISKAFESGAMQRAIEQAIVVIKQLGQIAGNVFSVIGSIFSAAQSSGGGMIGVLQQITSALATAFASPAVQSGLKAIFTTMATLASIVGPLLVQALGAIAPVFTALGPPIQRLIQALGPVLGQVIAALGPVLGAAATAVGALLDAVSPLLPVIGQLVAGLLPALTPLLSLVAGIFTALAPLVSQFASILTSALAPILAALVPAIQPIVDALMVLVEAVFPILSAQAAAFAPIIAQLAGIFAQLMVALGPVIAQLILLVADILTAATPVLTAVMEVVSRLASVFANELATVLQTVVVPALQAITALLSGDFSGAWQAAKTMVSGIIDSWIRTFIELPAKAATALSGLASAVGTKVSEAGSRMVDSIKEKISDALGKLRALPGQAKEALGDLGSKLYDSGASLVRGFVDGIKSMIGRVRDAASSVVSGARDYFPFSPAKEGPFSGQGWTLFSGRSLAEGFATGIGTRAEVVSQAVRQMLERAQAVAAGGDIRLGVPEGMLGALPGGSFGPGGSSPSVGDQRVIVELAGPRELTSVIRRIVQVDGRGNVQTAFGTS